MEASLGQKNFDNGSKLQNQSYKTTKNARKICENQISEYLKMI